MAEETIAKATVTLWQAVGGFLKAAANDAEVELLRRLQHAQSVGLTVEWRPMPKVYLRGIDAHGAFEQQYTLRADIKGLN